MSPTSEPTADEPQHRSPDVDHTNLTSAPELTAADLGLTFEGGHRAIEEVGFRIAPGEFVSIVGPSGCGKSTLLRLVAGLLTPTAGTLDVGATSRDEHRPAFVFQDPRLLPWRSVTGNVRLPLELLGQTSAETAATIASALELVGLTGEDATKSPRMLSGGMRMRVSLARALVTEPTLFLLDEPFGALDDIIRQRLNEDLVAIWQQRRPTTLFVTHNVSEAVFLSQRVLVMTPGPGRIAAEFAVPFEFPRRPGLRAETRFAELTGEVSATLREVSA
ncbi:Bicarbonate transport ATP-binding protein CmpD [Maioricimonas rarisocia]|uniref:Bicarbonate transport ATP-binding protein CmpD n=1 Tax=Maioricimonas rarisocia TaxID=2528026 RepID=A0A517Z9M6_9PLAN|nr:ABC transporter ATP-binding protein [Maioricimonas rarisocia]QDU39159.1 Bicarbonate transport ATP-binding protein CmpD [Maioricimonas rarisocia]